MRRIWVPLTALGVLIAVALFWSHSSAVPVVEADAPVAQPDREFHPVEVQSRGSEGLTLAGVVRDATGAPVANAEVFLAASGQESLASLHCQTCQAR